MTKQERDRLVTLKKAKKQLITQQKAAEELEISDRQIRRLLQRLKERGDKAVIHGLKGRASNRRIPAARQEKAVRILSKPAYEGFGPTLAREYLRDQHELVVSKETLRQWMIQHQLWRAQRAKPEPVHTWRERRSRCGELVQWDTSEHAWLEGRGEKLYLIAMIDDATSRLTARFAAHDSTQENMRLLWRYLEQHGRPERFYTDKASLFRTTEKRRRDEPGVDQDPVEMPPTQIGRALRELGIAWSAAHSPQAKGRVERCFGTAQDRLVKGLRQAGAHSLEQANQYLEETYLPWWNGTLAIEPQQEQDVHRPLEPNMSLASAVSYVEARQVGNDYTFRLDGARYQIERADIAVGMRQARVRIERRLDGSLAVRFQDRYLKIKPCQAPLPQPVKVAPDVPPKRAKRKSDWNKNFDLHKAPPIWQAAKASGHKS